MGKSQGTCKLDIVENLTPLDLSMTFFDISLTMSLIYRKLYIFVIFSNNE